MARPCDTCNGQSRIQTPDGSAWQKCPTCEGEGVIHNLEQYDISIPNTTVAANGSGVAQVQNKDFPIDLSFAAAQSTGPFSVMLQIGHRFYSNDVIHSSNFFGTGQQLRPLAAPIHMEPGDTMVVTLADLSGASNNIWITFQGVQEK